MTISFKRVGLIGAFITVLTACTSSGPSGHAPQTHTQAISPSLSQQAPAVDRTAILAMTGHYRVTFDFTETVAFKDGYDLKPKKISHAREVVFVIEDKPNFISLQHILVAKAGPDSDQYFPIKHWRQDWQWQPTEIHQFVGGNAWQVKQLTDQERQGKWSQTVYQVDDAPRYSGLANWSHTHQASIWQADRAWRPLPRRDATTRDDYQVIEAVNRHAITPNGWVHEQDNRKLVINDGKPELLAMEVGVNTYKKASDYPTKVATDYWQNTKDFWAGIRKKWAEIGTTKSGFYALTVQGEPEALYMPILGIASAVASGEETTEDALKQAYEMIDSHSYTYITSLKERLSGKADSKQGR